MSCGSWMSGWAGRVAIVSSRPLLKIGALATIALALSGCRPDPYDTGIDGVLWRRVAEYLDPIKSFTYNGYEPYDAPDMPVGTYLDLVPAIKWDRMRDPEASWFESGGAVIHDIERTETQLSFDVFVSSGPRPADVPTDDGYPYFGPGTVYTCFGFVVQVENEAISRDPYEDFTAREARASCDPQLVALLADDAAFAEIDSFNG